MRLMGIWTKLSQGFESNALEFVAIFVPKYVPITVYGENFVYAT